MSTMHHYFDDTHPLRAYTISLPANPGALPAANATDKAPPAVVAGKWPCWSGKQWQQIEDHRKRDDQGATEYWLPGDTWESPARTITDIGPLPEGAVTERPEKPMDAVLADTLADYEARIQQRLDDFARTLTYDGIMSACTYATSGVDMYRIEGQYCVDARDATWAKAYELLSAILPTVRAGGAIPAWEDIEAQLPVLTWPEGSRGYGG